MIKLRLGGKGLHLVSHLPSFGFAFCETGSQFIAKANPAGLELEEILPLSLLMLQLQVWPTPHIG